MATGIITMNRGEFFSFDAAIYDDSTPSGLYEMKANDVLYFALMEPHSKFEDAIILRAYGIYDGALIPGTKSRMFTIEINRGDTVNLAPGTYYYTLKLQKNVPADLLADGMGLSDPNAQLSTVVKRTKFIIHE